MTSRVEEAGWVRLAQHSGRIGSHGAVDPHLFGEVFYTSILGQGLWLSGFVWQALDGLNVWIRWT